MRPCSPRIGLRAFVRMILIAGSLGIGVEGAAVVGSSIALGASAPEDVSFGWTWDQVSLRPTADGEVECAVQGAFFHYAAPGEPDLPAILVTIPAPEGSRPASFEITGAVTSDHDLAQPIAPRWEDRPTQEGGPVPVPPLQSAYQALSYPTERVRFLGISMKRGHALASFAVYPVTLERGRRLILLEQGTLTVGWRADATVPLPLKTLRPESNVGEGSESGPARPPSDRPSLAGGAVRYLIVTTDAFAPLVQPLVDWKNRIGTPAAIRSVEWIYRTYPEGVDRQERIRNFLQEAYRYWGTEWVLIVGGPDQVPIRTAVYLSLNYPEGTDIITDYYYACLDGTWNADGDDRFGEAQRDPSGGDPGNPIGDDADFSPELYVGRIPATSADQLTTWLSKYFRYVQAPDGGGYLNNMLLLGEVLFHQSWDRSRIGTCDALQCPPSCNQICVSVDGGTDCVNAINVIQGSGAPISFTEMYEYYEYWRDRQNRPNAILERKDAVISKLNAGAGWIQHVGHGDFDRIAVGTDDGTTSQARIVNSEARALTNAGRPGIVYSIDCSSAAIDHDCIAAAFLFAPNGGEAAWIGDANLDFPAAAHDYQENFFEKVFVEKEELGRAFDDVQDLMARYIGNQENNQRFLTFALMPLCEPQMTPWLASPGSMLVSAPSTVALGDSIYQVTVQSGGLPVTGATVCAYKAGDVYATAVTDAGGIARVPFHPTTTGTFRVTATHPRLVPRSTAGTVTTPPGSAILATGIQVVDGGDRVGTTGNANGRLEEGETVDIDLSLRNGGGAAAPGVQVDLLIDASGTGPYLDVIKGSDSRDIGANESVVIPGAFRVRVLPGAPDSLFQNMDRLPFDLTVRTTEGTDMEAFSIPLYAYRPILQLRGGDLREVDGTGNGDNHPDNGETILYKPVFRNLGTGSAVALRASIAAVSGATVEEGVADLGPAEQGEDFTAAQDMRFHVDDASTLLLRLTVTSTLDAGFVPFVRTIDFTAPDPPSFPADSSGTPSRPKGTKDAISLVWDPPAAPDAQGYVLSRATDPAGAYQPVTSGLLTSMRYYRDEGLPGLTRYYYKVAAVDSSGNRSADSEACEATTGPGEASGWPVSMVDISPGCPAVEDIDSGGGYEVFFNSDLIYGLRSDGTEITDGDGNEQTHGVWSGLGATFWAKPAIGDLDGDGIPEIVATSRQNTGASGTGQIFAWRNNGTLLWQRSAGGTSFLLSSPVIADIDADPQAEVIIESHGTIYAWNHDGSPVIATNPDGRFAYVAGGTPGSDDPITYGSPAVADLDGDGKGEIVFGLQTKAGPTAVVVVDGNGTILDTLQLETPSGSDKSCNSSAAIARVEGTSVFDIYIESKDWLWGLTWTGGRLHVLWQVGNGGLQTRPFDPSPAIGDVNGDGRLDVVGSGTGGLLLVVDAVTGAPVPGFPIRLPTGAKLGSPILVDLDGDPQTAEIVIGDSNGTVYAIDHNGASLPGFPYTEGGRVIQGLTCWDIDRDGHPNLLIQADQKSAVSNLDIYTVSFPSDVTEAIRRNPWPTFRHDARNTGCRDAVVVTPVMTMEANGTASTGTARLTWRSDLRPETFRVTRLEEDGSWATRVEGAVSEFSDGGGAYRWGDPGLDPGRYSYRIVGLDGVGKVVLQSDEIAITVAPVALRLIGAAPNPFGPRTAIRYESPAGDVWLDVFDLAGRRVRSLVEARVPAGAHEVIWDGTDEAGHPVGAGVYLARLRGTNRGDRGGVTRSAKILVVR